MSAVAARLTAAFDAAGDQAEDVAGTAARLLADPDWLAPLLAPHLAALVTDPWSEPPFRAAADALRSGAVLFAHPRVTIAASVTRARALRERPAAQTVVVAGRLAVVRYVRGGGATLLRWSADRAEADFVAAAAAPCRPLPSIALTDGLVRVADGRSEAVLIERAEDDVVTVTAAVAPGAASVMREYDRATGALLRCAALDDAASRALVLVELLRHAPPDQAADGFAAATREPAFFARWAAMRAWLSRDLAAALPRLRDMAEADPHPDVRTAARATLPLVLTRMET